MKYLSYKEQMKDWGVDADGHWGPLVAHIIEAYIQDTPEPINLLEIGRYRGTSLALFRYLLPQSYILSIDIKNTHDADRVIQLLQQHYDATSDIIEDSSANLLNYTQDKLYHFVLIDGSHRYADAKLDFELTEKITNEDSIIFFDDIDHPAGCGNVLNDIDINKYDVYRFRTNPDPNYNQNFSVIVRKNKFNFLKDIPNFYPFIS